MKKGGGRRYYRPEDIELLAGIRLFLYEKEFSIKSLQALLREQGPEAVAIPTAEPKQSSKPKTASKKAEAPQKPSSASIASEPKRADNSSPTKQEELRDILSRLTGAREKLSASLKKQ